MPTPNHPERVWYPPGVAAFGGGILQLTSQAWAMYLGYVDFPGVTAKFIEAEIATLGVGTQVAEMGLFSSPIAPNNTDQTLTKLAASGSLTSMTTGTPPFMVRTAALNFAIAASTHIWGVWRCAFTNTPTQPTMYEGTSKTNLGDVMWIANPNATTALTAATTLAFVRPSMANVNHGAPFMRMTED